MSSLFIHKCFVIHIFQREIFDYSIHTAFIQMLGFQLLVGWDILKKKLNINII